MKDSSKFATKNYSARLFLLLYVLTVVVGWIFALGNSYSVVTAFSIFVGVGFAVAAVACALTRRAPLWLLGFLGGVGIVLVLMGIYFRVTQPDGILTGYLIPIGFGFFLAEAAVAIERYWHRRH
ncbi:hypothetical protein [Corynebacterium glutamicum]|uniref:hypothetical protein n=1 Tax=Corynebacterium glutamicum TaxID=1718 RepID=UPI00058A5308|nr:hypothetical protein [Corynebacterium glutamicum]KIH74340.1 hypothetical protein SD36_03970 [Corynebacterium glutamicum]